MAWDYTHVELLAGIKLRASIPTAAGSWTNANLLGEADRQIRSVIYPDILSVREDYYVATGDQSIVAAQATYRIPARAFNGRVIDVNIVDTNGNELDTPRIDIGDIPHYQSSSNQAVEAAAYVLDGSLVRLYPTPSTASGSVRIRYMRGPSQIVSTGYETITAVASTTSVTVDAGTVGDDDVDVIAGTNPFESLADSAASTITSTTRVFTTAVTHIAIGDYVCEEGETPVPQVPQQAHDVLEQAVAVKVLESMRAHTSLAEAKSLLEQMRVDFRASLTPRVSADPVRTTNWNSPLRLSQRFLGRRW